MYLPIGLFGVSVATAATPAISRLVAERLRAHPIDAAGALGLMLFLNVPATIGLIVLARPIIAVIFEHGSSPRPTPSPPPRRCSCMRSGLVGYSVVRIVSPTFYALGRSRIPVMVSVGSVLVNIVLNVRWFGAWDIAAWRSAPRLRRSSTPRVQMLLLRREIHGIDGSRIATSFARVHRASAVMGVVTWALHQLMLTQCCPARR